MTYSICWQANVSGYVIIRKDGIRVCGHEESANDASYSEAFVSGKAKRPAEDIAASLQSLARPTIDVHEGQDLWE